jgi:hypothetical protein
MKNYLSAFCLIGRLSFLLVLVVLMVASFASGQTARIVDIATDTWDPSDLSDTEPSIAVNPANPLEIAVVSFSEGWGPSDMGPVWRSTDGGATWIKAFQLPQPGAASGSPGDQKISFDTTGDLFIAELGFGIPVPRNFIYRQTGGAAAAFTLGAAYGDDQPHLDVSHAGGCPNSLYSPWLNFGVANERSTVSNSVNAGVTMTDVPAGDNSTFPNRTTRIAVAPNGRAYIIYKTREGTVGAPANFENAHFHVNRSDDCGATWTGLGGVAGVSVHGATAVQTWFTTSFGNSTKGKVARARSSDAWIAVDPGDGDIYAAYVDNDASGFGQIYVARSTDQGANWNSFRVTNGSFHSAYPEIAVAEDGTVGVLYIDFDDSGTNTIFRHRFARSFNNGNTWSDQILQSMDPGPLANADDGFLWGDYEGLTAVGNMFYGVFTGESIGRTTAQLDPIFFSEVALLVPQIQVPGEVSFNDVCVGATAQGTLTICNTGKADLIVQGINNTNPEFSITSPSAGFPVTISKDFCFPFQVVIAPTAVGPKSTTFVVSSNDPNHPSVQVKTTAAAVAPEIRVTGSTEFGVASAWKPAEKIVKVCNIGACNLSAISAAINCTDFTLINNPLPATISHDFCLDVVVAYTPTLPGTHTCQFTITSNDASNPTVTRTLHARTPGFLSLHAGLAHPHGAFANAVKNGSTLNLDFLYPFKPNWAWDVRGGISRFDGKPGHPDISAWQLSPNIKFTLNPADPVRLFFNGGLGLYHFDSGNFEAGGNLGAGINIPVGHRFALEGTYNYHAAFTASPVVKYSQFQLGLLVSL